MPGGSGLGIAFMFLEYLKTLLVMLSGIKNQIISDLIPRNGTHAARSALRRIRRLAVCQSENLAFTSRTSRSVSPRMSACQSGESISASS